MVEPVGDALGMRWTREGLSQDMGDVKARHEANRQSWNEAALVYERQLGEWVDFLRAGKSSLHEIERRNLGDLSKWCRSAVHLQCASGRDTLSLWHEGVKNITGVDISDVHIANARRLSAATGIPARWFCCDVLTPPEELSVSADLVITGRGAINWLHDLNAWGNVIARILKPGGVFHLLDDHPVSWLFRGECEDLQASQINYFQHAESSTGWPATYIGNQAKSGECESRKFERLWPISTVFKALRDAGLSIEHLGEHNEGYWDNFPALRADLRSTIPVTFSIMAKRPG